MSVGIEVDTKTEVDELVIGFCPGCGSFFAEETYDDGNSVPYSAVGELALERDTMECVDCGALALMEQPPGDPRYPAANCAIYGDAYRPPGRKGA